MQGLTLSPEQEAIIATNENLKINAVAGSGKTSTLIAYAASRPAGSRILYLAFNRTVRLEAKTKFEKAGLHHVVVETAHSLAFAHVVRQSRYTVKEDLKVYELAHDIAQQSGLPRPEAMVVANHVLKFIHYFCNSSAAKVQELNYVAVAGDEAAMQFAEQHYALIEHHTRRLLAAMHRAAIGITHDFYLKLFQLQNVALPFDYILFDEAQDASPTMLSIFLQQPCVKVMVGDQHQQIYRFRHAVNSLERVRWKTLGLTKSFRFGEEIATAARVVLDYKKMYQNVGSAVISGTPQIAPTKLSTAATLARTNVGLLKAAINYLTDHPRVHHLYFEGGLNSYVYANEGGSLYDVLYLFKGERTKINHHLVGQFKDIGELEEYIDHAGDYSLGSLLEIVEEYGDEIFDLMRRLKALQVEAKDKAGAAMIFSTVHKCKGLEYDEVFLADDFVNSWKIDKQLEELGPAAHAGLDEEINLLYVAVTRARFKLWVPEKIKPYALLNGNAVVNIVAPAAAPVKTADPRQRPLPGLVIPAADKSVRQPKTGGSNDRSGQRYAPWDEKQDKLLQQMYLRNLSIAEMATHFERTKGAIIARLKKLEVYEE